MSQIWRPSCCVPALVQRGRKEGILDSKHLCFCDISKVSPLEITVTLSWGSLITHNARRITRMAQARHTVA